MKENDFPLFFYEERKFQRKSQGEEPERFSTKAEKLLNGFSGSDRSAVTAFAPTPILVKSFLRFTEGKTSVDLRKYGIVRKLYLTVK